MQFQANGCHYFSGRAYAHVPVHHFGARTVIIGCGVHLGDVRLADAGGREKVTMQGGKRDYGKLQERLMDFEILCGLGNFFSLTQICCFLDIRER